MQTIQALSENLDQFEGCVVVVCGKCDRTGGNLCIRPAIATGNEGRHNNGRRSLFFLRCCLPLQEEEGGNVVVGHDSPAPCVPIAVNRWMEVEGGIEEGNVTKPRTYIG